MCSKLIAYNKDFFSDMVVDAVMCLDSYLPLNMIGTFLVKICSVQITLFPAEIVPMPSAMIWEAASPLLWDLLPLLCLYQPFSGIKKVTGGSVTDSKLVKGVAFKKTFSYAGFEMQPKTYVNPKVLSLNIELELKAERDNAECRIDNVEVILGIFCGS
jgi:hypothetical protein